MDLLSAAAPLSPWEEEEEEEEKWQRFLCGQFLNIKQQGTKNSSKKTKD